jgi:hypothetical protein
VAARKSQTVTSSRRSSTASDGEETDSTLRLTTVLERFGCCPFYVTSRIDQARVLVVRVEQLKTMSKDLHTYKNLCEDQKKECGQLSATLVLALASVRAMSMDSF